MSMGLPRLFYRLTLGFSVPYLFITKSPLNSVIELHYTKPLTEQINYLEKQPNRRTKYKWRTWAIDTVTRKKSGKKKRKTKRSLILKEEKPDPLKTVYLVYRFPRWC